MIETNLHMQLLRCSKCATVHEIPRRVANDPEQLLNFKDEVKRDHRECSEYSDVGLAINARTMRKRIEAALAERQRSKRGAYRGSPSSNRDRFHADAQSLQAGHSA